MALDSQTNLYGERFFSSHRAGSESSARRMAPMILEMAAARRVIDVGCGIGTWLRAFMDLGVSDVRGVDGPWVKPEQLLIPRERFISADLTRELAVGAEQTFDLAVSLEVAEHLPEASAGTFVASLTRLAPVVVFSAAAPMQGGTGHVNEQWPAYWAERFASHGYSAIDCLRRRVWNDPDVEWWYAQNTIVYASEAGLAKNPALRAAEVEKPEGIMPLIHPAWLAAHASEPLSLGRIIRELPRAIVGAVRGRLK